ncbi:hypothetical protein BRC90_10080, partial [Halobacteriales archaeon QS_4_69_34]
MREGKVRILRSPTALGKSHTVAATDWRENPEITGGEPVVMLSETTDARDDAAETTRAHGGECSVLLGRDEACPVAAGDHDDALTMNGTPASEWINEQCDRKGMTFSGAHARLAAHNDQQTDLPCSEGCTGNTQWSGVPRDDGEPTADVVHATGPFGFVPGLITDTNVFVDELTTFSLIGPGATDGGKHSDGLSHEDVRRAVTAFLKEADAPLDTFDALVTVAAHEGVPEPDGLGTALAHRPDPDWFYENRDAHALAPALTRGIWRAAGDEPDANGRRMARWVEHYPPRLDADERGPETKQWVNIVLNPDNTVTTLRSIPNLDSARSVIGLDAHPSWPLWAANIGPGLSVNSVFALAKEIVGQESWRCESVAGKGDAAASPGRNVP